MNLNYSSRFSLVGCFFQIPVGVEFAFLLCTSMCPFVYWMKISLTKPFPIPAGLNVIIRSAAASSLAALKCRGSASTSYGVLFFIFPLTFPGAHQRLVCAALCPKPSWSSPAPLYLLPSSFHLTQIPTLTQGSDLPIRMLLTHHLCGHLFKAFTVHSPEFLHLRWIDV